MCLNKDPLVCRYNLHIFSVGFLKCCWIVLIFCLPSTTSAFDIKKGLVIQFEDYLSKKVKPKTMQDGIFMHVLNFDWHVLHEVMTREVCNVKKEQNQKRDRSWLQIKQQQKSDNSSGTQVKIFKPKCLIFLL